MDEPSTTIPEGEELGRFSALFEPVAPSLRAWAELRLGPGMRRRLDPEDVVQEVCCRALTRFADFDPERGGFRPWLFGIANHVIKDAARQLARQGMQQILLGVSSGGGLDALPLAVTTIVTRLSRDEGLERFIARARDLGEAERRLLVLRGIEGLSHEATGDLLGIGPDAVAQRWSRLRKKLGRWGPDATWLAD